MNNVILIGNITRDPDVRYTSAQDPVCVCRMSLAVNEGYGENQKTNYIPIVAFGRTGENCERYLKKGSKIAVQGKIQTGSYEKDGQKIYTTEVVADKVEF